MYTDIIHTCIYTYIYIHTSIQYTSILVLGIARPWPKNATPDGLHRPCGERANNLYRRKRTVLKSSRKPEEEVARKPGKKKSRFKPTGRS